MHRALGPGLLEKVYESCLCAELDLRGLRYERQKVLPVRYKTVVIDCGYRLDVVVDGKVLVELKTVDSLHPVHEAQLITYLRLARIPVGLLVNFNVSVLRHGIRRLVAHR